MEACLGLRDYQERRSEVAGRRGCRGEGPAKVGGARGGGCGSGKRRGCKWGGVSSGRGCQRQRGWVCKEERVQAGGGSAVVGFQKGEDWVCKRGGVGGGRDWKRQRVWVHQDERLQGVKHLTRLGCASEAGIGSRTGCKRRV